MNPSWTEGNLNSHIDTIHEGFNNYGFDVITALQQRVTWTDISTQLMKERKKETT